MCPRWRMCNRWVNTHPSRGATGTQPQPASAQVSNSSDSLRERGNLDFNVPIFKKLAQLFLKHYVGQQNRSVGCQFVTFVLKQDHCSFTVSFCPSQTHFPESPWRALSPLSLAPQGSALQCVTYLWGSPVPSASWDHASLPAWDSLAAMFALHPLINPVSPSSGFIWHDLPFTSVHVAGPT